MPALDLTQAVSVCILRSQCFKTLSLDNKIRQCFILVKSGSSVNVAFSVSFITQHNKLECLNNLYLGLESVRDKIGTRIMFHLNNLVKCQVGSEELATGKH